MFNLLKSNSIYAIGSVANSAALFLLIPFLINNLSIEEYGAWSLLELLILLFVMLALPGLEIALMREYWFLEDGSKKIQLSSTLIWFVLIWGGLLALIGSIVTYYFGSGFGIPGAPVTIIIALIAGYLEALVNVFLSVFRIREESWKFTLTSIARMGIFMGLSVLFISNGLGLTGAILGRAVAGFVVLLFGLVIGYQNFSWVFSWIQLKDLARYGLPLLPSRGAQYILQSSDRYILTLFTDLTVVGIYSFAYKVAAGLDVLIIRPFATDWGARRFKIATYENPKKYYSLILIAYAGVSMFSALILLSIVPELYGWIAPESFIIGINVVPIILAAYVVYGLAQPLNIGMMLKDKTKYAPMIGFVSAAGSLALNFLLIPRYGMMGAAWATLISYVIWTAGITIVSQYYYRVPYNIKSIMLLIGATIAGYMGIWSIDQSGLGESWFLGPFLFKLIWLFIIYLPVGFSIAKIEKIWLPIIKSIYPNRPT